MLNICIISASILSVNVLKKEFTVRQIPLRGGFARRTLLRRPAHYVVSLCAAGRSAPRLFRAFYARKKVNREDEQKHAEKRDP